MSSHIHELWAELDLPELYPEPDPARVRARVGAALDGERSPVPVQTRPAAKQRVRAALLLAAVLALTAGSALAAYRADLLALFFPGDDTSALAPYVQTALDTIETKDWRATVDSALYDGQSLYAVITLQGKTPEAAEGLTSGEIVADGYWDYYLDVQQARGSTVVPSDRAGVVQPILDGKTPGDLLVCDIDAYAGWYHVRELEPAAPGSRTWAFQLRMGDYLGARPEPFTLWFSFLGPELSVQIPLDRPVEPVRLSPALTVEADWRQGLEGTLTDVSLTPLSCTFTLERRGDWVRGEYLTNMEPMDTKEVQLFALRRSDGTLLTPWALGSTDTVSTLADGSYVGLRDLAGREDLSGTGLIVSCTFDAPLDLEDVTSFLYGGWEFPLDGSAPVPVEDPALKEAFFPFDVHPLRSGPDRGIDPGYASNLEELCENLGAGYRYDRPARAATVTWQGRTVVLTADSSTALVDGEPLELDRPAVKDGLSLAVPVDLLTRIWDLELEPRFQPTEQAEGTGEVLSGYTASPAWS